MINQNIKNSDLIMAKLAKQQMFDMVDKFMLQQTSKPEVPVVNAIQPDHQCINRMYQGGHLFCVDCGMCIEDSESDD